VGEAGGSEVSVKTDHRANQKWDRWKQAYRSLVNANEALAAVRVRMVAAEKTQARAQTWERKCFDEMTRVTHKTRSG
jgi:hypothetical protein